jgi:hypothetical protein
LRPIHPNFFQLSYNIGLEGCKFEIGGTNVISHSFEFLRVLFGFGLQVKDLLVASGGHLVMRGVGEGKWVHKKKYREMIYIMVIRMKRGMKSYMCLIRVLGRVGCPQFCFLRSDKYHNDQYKEINSIV